MIADEETAALVGSDGSIDWFCVPRFDSAACSAALLGTPEHVRWLLAPAGDVRRKRRRYRDRTLVLETELEAADGTVRLVDFMPPRHGHADIARVVEGVHGRVEMRMELVIRFDYGSVVPWVRRLPSGALSAVAGPDALCLRAPVAHRGQGFTTRRAVLGGGGRARAVHARVVSLARAAARDDGSAAGARKPPEAAEAHWRAWCDRCTYDGGWRNAVLRSLLVLKALAYAPTGGIVAASTTSLPEQIGGVRNWDSRYCWLPRRDLQPLRAAGRRLRRGSDRLARPAPAGRRRAARRAADPPWSGGRAPHPRGRDPMAAGLRGIASRADRQRRRPAAAARRLRRGERAAKEAARSRVAELEAELARRHPRAP